MVNCQGSGVSPSGSSTSGELVAHSRFVHLSRGDHWVGFSSRGVTLFRPTTTTREPHSPHGSGQELPRSGI